MANYWVDLDVATRPASAGTDGDPFGVAEFIADMVGAISNNTYALRGKGSYTGSVTVVFRHALVAWNLTNYGPWRLRINGDLAKYQSGSIEDGVLSVVGMPLWAACMTSINRCVLMADVSAYVSSSALQAAVITNSTIIVTDAEFGLHDNYAQGAATLTNNVWVFQNALGFDRGIDNVTGYGTADVNHTNNVTNRPTWAKYTEGSAGHTDVGGQRYGMTFPAIPAWNDPDLSKFNLFPTHGVGAGGCWAEPIPLHVDISEAYDGTAARTGEAAAPADITDLAAHTSPLAYNEYKMRGDRIVIGAVNVALTPGNQTLDGVDVTDPTLPDRWTVDASVANFGFAGFDGDGDVFKRLAICQGTINNHPGNDNYTQYFVNCYFLHASAVNISPGRPTILYFRGCTFYTPLVFVHYAGSMTVIFDSCVFFDSVFDTDHGYVGISAYKCWFTNKSQADVAAACAFPPNFTGCTFGQPALLYPPATPSDVSRSNMSYLQYGLPEITDAVSLAEFVTKDFNIGFGENTRYGYGAFYFGPVTLSLTAAPDHGVAPLPVLFTAGGTWSGATPVSYAWTFGDGGVSTESSPTHVYTMPGTWYPTVTVVFNNGSSLTYVGDPVYVYDTDYSPGTPNPSRTDTCYRTPVLPGDGYGPSEYGDGDRPGYDWVWPAARVGLVTCYDEVNKEVIIGWDAKTQLRYHLNDPDSWKDRESVGGYPGNRIIAEVHHKADAASAGEHAAIVHTEHHSYFKPFDPLKHDTAGYDSEGYPTDMRVDSSVHINCVPDVAAAITRRIPKDGDLVFTERVEARSIQLRKRIYEAPWFYTGTRIDYETLDKAARPSLRLMSEESYQDELGSGPLFHVSRNFIPTINRATGVACSGSADTTVVGPDGMDRSAIGFFPASAGLSDTLTASLAGDFSALVWTKWATVGVLPQRMWTVGVFEVTIELIGGQRMLVIDDAINPVMMDILPGTGIDWEHVAIVRSGLYLRVYADGVLLGQHPLSTSADYGDSLSRCGGDGIGIADALIVPRAVSVEALEYYVEDVTIRNGRQCLPEY